MSLSLSSENKVLQLLQSELFCENQLEQYISEKNVNSLLSDGSTPLIAAINYQNSGAIAYLLELGANIEQPGSDQKTPFMMAVLSGNSEIVDFLLDNNCRVPLYDTEFFPILILAIRHHMRKLIILLLDTYGADVNEVVAAEQLTPLVVATELNHFDVIKILVRHRADVNLAPSNYLTPLATAAIHRNLFLVKYFLHVGGNINLAKKSIKSTLDYTLSQEDLSDFDDQINELRDGFEFLLAAAKEDVEEELAHNRFEFFNEHHAASKPSPKSSN